MGHWALLLVLGVFVHKDLMGRAARAWKGVPHFEDYFRGLMMQRAMRQSPKKKTNSLNGGDKEPIEGR